MADATIGRRRHRANLVSIVTRGGPSDRYTARSSEKVTVICDMKTQVKIYAEWLECQPSGWLT